MMQTRAESSLLFMPSAAHLRVSNAKIGSVWMCPDLFCYVSVHFIATSAWYYDKSQECPLKLSQEAIFWRWLWRWLWLICTQRHKVILTMTMTITMT